MELAQEARHPSGSSGTSRPTSCADAQEVFVTGTAAEVTPVSEIGEHSYQLGPITGQLMDDFRALTRGREMAA